MPLRVRSCVKEMEMVMCDDYGQLNYVDMWEKESKMRGWELLRM